MTIRIFSKTHNLYTNSPLWPSNQRSFSDFFVAPDGKVIEAIHCLGQNPNGEIEDFVSLEFHDSKKFHVEPWTGYFDSAGKKIYRGDILEMFSMFHFVSEVTWKDGAFWTKALDKEGGDNQFSPYLTSHWTIKGNIHGVEYSE